MRPTGLNDDKSTAREMLSKLCERRLAPDEITTEMSLTDDLGIESLQFIRLVLQLEEELGRKVFDVETLSGIKTVDDLYKALARE
ncbi:MAG TPA: phosphopantetheine-binding protein [Blastocatellia bacterium]|jgi:acyl carrier protein